jgi:photosystem II stability/assembly factor-like uncharacterized protein
MFRLALLLMAAWPAAASLPCWVHGAAAAGNSVWLLCERGVVLHSADLGAKWQTARIATEGKLHDIDFMDEKRGIIAAGAGTLWITGDGGRTWTARKLDTTDPLTSVAVVGERVWVGGYGGTVFHSPDAGATWVRQPTTATRAINDIFFLDENHGWAVGWVGLILRTADGGRTWHEIRTAATGWTLAAVRFRDPMNGWIVGPFGQILRSRDGGLTWTQLESPVRSWLSSIYFDAEGRGWITADRDILTSEDGETWRALGLEEWMFLEQILPVSGQLWGIGPFGLMVNDGPATKPWRRFEPAFPSNT